MRTRCLSPRFSSLRVSVFVVRMVEIALISLESLMEMRLHVMLYSEVIGSFSSTKNKYELHTEHKAKEAG